MRQIRKQVLTGTESIKDAQILPIRDSNRQKTFEVISDALDVILSKRLAYRYCKFRFQFEAHFESTKDFCQMNTAFIDR